MFSQIFIIVMELKIRPEVLAQATQTDCLLLKPKRKVNLKKKFDLLIRKNFSILQNYNEKFLL